MMKRHDQSKDLLLARCESIIKTLQDLLTEAQQERAEALQESAGLEKALREKEFAVSKMKGQLVHLQHCLTEADRNVVSFKERIDELEEQNAMLAGKLQRSEIEKDRLSEEWQAVLGQVQEKVKAQERRKKALEQSLVQEQQEGKKMRESVIRESANGYKIQLLEKELRGKQGQLSELQQKVSTLQRENLTLKDKLTLKQDYFSFDKVKGQESRISQLEESLRDLKKEHELQHRELTILRNEKELMSNRLDRERKHYHELARNISTCKASLWESGSPIRNLQNSQTPNKKSILIEQEKGLSSSRRRRILSEAERLQNLLSKNIQLIKGGR